MRVVLADDSALFREGLGRMLRERGFDVRASVGDPDQLLVAVEREIPEVVVTDIRMPPHQSIEGLEAARTIRARWPEVGVVVLSQVVETHHALEFLVEGGGHFGYLLKDRVANLSEFAASVRRVGEGGTAIDPDVVSALLAQRRVTDPLEGLTPRELEILELMAQGRSNRGICEALVLSRRTVESHVRNVFMKLDLPEAEEDHRRVLAALTYLRGHS